MDNIYFSYLIRDIKVDLKGVEEHFILFDFDREYIKKEVKNLSGGEKHRIALISVASRFFQNN